MVCSSKEEAFVREAVSTIAKGLLEYPIPRAGRASKKEHLQRHLDLFKGLVDCMEKTQITPKPRLGLDFMVMFSCNEK